MGVSLQLSATQREPIPLHFPFLVYTNFRRVIGTQVIISAINTILTSFFVYAFGLPYATMVIILCGMIPVVGNLISNTLIVGPGFAISEQFACSALLFLGVIHNLEYPLNSRIIGGRARCG